MKTTTLPAPIRSLFKTGTLLASLSFACLASQTTAATTIISDTFGSPGDPSASLNGQTADTGQTWSAFTEWTTENGNALYDGGLGNGMAGITLGSGYFDSNPGIYELAATVTLDTTGAEWVAIGFSDTIGIGSGNGFFQASAFAGEPWMLLRGNGGALVRSASGSSSDLVSADSGTFATTNSTLRIVYDTSVANWTVDAYINGTQLDLNGTAVGSTFTYSSNPTDIGSVGLTGNTNVEATLHDFSLTVIPEPASVSLLIASTSLASCLLLRRRRR